MARSTVVVVGSVNMDLVVRVAQLPRPGETVLGGELDRGAGGKGANQAVAARRLGARSVLVGQVGDDEFGAQLLATLADEGVDLTGTMSVSGPTGTALIVVDAAGENTITCSPGANGRLRPDRLAALHAPLARAGALLLQLEIPVASSSAAARLARGLGVPVILNAAPLPATVDESLLRLIALADLLVVNETEAAGLIGTASAAAVAADPGGCARRLRRLGPAAVVITLGARGAALAGPDGHDRRFPAFAVPAVDSVGAGDAFCAELAVATAGQVGDLAAAVRRACAAGALATTRSGALGALPTRAEVDALLAHDDDHLANHRPVEGAVHDAP